MSVLVLLGAVSLQVAAAQPSTTQPPMRDPAFARDGRLAVSIDGDLWIQRSAGRDAAWQRVTSGPAWDREPAWTPDGSAIVFTSDRAGALDLWRVRLGSGGATSEPERITTDSADEMQPSVAANGSIVFTRGRESRARLWVRDSAGAERRLTSGNAPERWGTLSPDGRMVAYVQLTDDGRRVRVRGVAAGAPDSVIVTERGAERPAWSPDGDRIAFSSTTPSPGVYVTTREGAYVNLATAVRGDVSWSPDASTLAIAESDGVEPGYNGDPRRLLDRVAESLGNVTRLRWVAAPAPLDTRVAMASAPSPESRPVRNAELFDRIWSRIDRLYYSGPAAATRHAEWERMRDANRARAVAATSDLELSRVVHEMLRARPTLNPEAVGRAAVASAHPVATEAGLEMMRKGGNVVDAAVAVSFALGVVEPDASGMGGYGEMLVQIQGMERPALFEFMARVPEEGGLSNASLLQNGRYPSDGPVLAMIPGTVAGMHAAWKQYGSKKLAWSDLLAPAIKAARDGYVVSDGLATTLMLEQAKFLKYEGSKALFFRDGKPLEAGDTLRNPDLAWTLEQVAKGGADGFYKGEVARRLVQDLRGKGNAVRLTDLSRYFAPERAPVEFTYRGNAVYSSAPPAGGGSILAGQLSNFERFASPKPYPDDAATLHAMIAAWQLAPSSRGRVADPSLWPVNTEPFTNKDTAAVRWRCYDPARAIDVAIFRGDSLACDKGSATDGAGARSGARGSGANTTVDVRDTSWTIDDERGVLGGDTPSPSGARDECAGLDHAAGAECRAQGTTAFTVGDADGNLVAVTQTLGTWGGNFYVSPGLGFLYNDKLTSYATDPNAYGARLPYARHGSTLAPTIVFRGSGASKRAWFAIGAAGNAWINSAVYQGVVGMSDLGLGPQRALELPRFLPGQRAGVGGSGRERAAVIDLEDGFSPDVIAKLREMGYHFDLVSLAGELRMGYGSAVMIDGDRVRGGGDPRRAGIAGAIPAGK